MIDNTKQENLGNILKRNTTSMSVAVFISRILGLLRDVVMAAFFGTTYAMDAFNIAFNIPNLLRRLFGEGALSAAFVPIYNEFGLKRGKRYQINFALNVLSVLTFLLLILSFLGVIFAPIIVRILYPGAEKETLHLAINLTRIMFPYLFFIGLSSTFIAILNSHSKFFVTGLSSAMLNIGWILFLIFGVIVYLQDAYSFKYIYQRQGIIGNLSSEILQSHDIVGNLIYFAAYGVMLGGLLQTIINLPLLKRLGYKLRIILKLKTNAMIMLWKRFVPAMLGLGIREINLIVDAQIASFLPVGGIAALGYANRLMQLPLGVFGIAVGTAVLPQYSRQFTEHKWADISETMCHSIKLILYLLTPITVTMIIGSETFVRLLFQRGIFGDIAVQQTSSTLICYTIGLCFYGLNQVITPVFFAAKDTKTPVKISACMVALNITLNIILMQSMQQAGIALATSITAIINFIIILLVMKKKLPLIKIKGLFKNIVTLIGVLIAMAYVLWFFNRSYIIDNTFFELFFKAGIFLIVTILTMAIAFRIKNSNP